MIEKEVVDIAWIRLLLCIVNFPLSALATRPPSPPLICPYPSINRKFNLLPGIAVNQPPAPRISFHLFLFAFFCRDIMTAERSKSSCGRLCALPAHELISPLSWQVCERSIWPSTSTLYAPPISRLAGTVEIKIIWLGPKQYLPKHPPPLYARPLTSTRWRPAYNSASRGSC